MTQPADIFLSYSESDKAIAALFAQGFAKEGLEVWWDDALRSGDSYDEVTEGALREARVVVVLWSKSSVVSRWVRSEATIADRRKTLIPVSIEPCDKPVIFELTQTADMSAWNGDPSDPLWQAFHAEVRDFIARERAAPALVNTARTPALSPAKKGQRGHAPTLAVMPFTNRSGLEEDEVFALGMVEDLIDALSHAVNVRVVSSSATARYCSGPVPNVEALGQQLGVRYLLEGNVRRVGTNLRVTSQLVEAKSGEVVWTERFARPLSDLAMLQEDLIEELALHLGTQVYRMAMEQALKKPEDLTAWEYCMRALAALRQLNGVALGDAVAAAQEAVKIDPNYGLAHALYAHPTALAYYFFSPDNPEEVTRIKGHVDRAMACGGDNAAVLAHVAFAQMYLGNGEEGYRCATRSHDLNPGYGFAQLAAGISGGMIGRNRDALAHLDDFMRIEPQSPYTHYALVWQAVAYLGEENWEEADRVLRESLVVNPLAGYNYFRLSLVTYHLGNEEEAVRFMIKAREYEPTSTREVWEMRLHRSAPASPSMPALKSHLSTVWSLTEGRI